MDTVRKNIEATFCRYLELLLAERTCVMGIWGYRRPVQMCITALAEIDNYSIARLSNHLGIVQGMLHVRKLIDLDKEIADGI